MEKDELQEFKEEIKEYDFFAEGKNDFFDGRVAPSDIIYGKHWDKAPLVTIIITTYKRPRLLKQALESALRQENFIDYQVLVIDNEAAPLEQETETSVLMQLYKDNEKVIYYRNRVVANYRMDTAVYYAQSKWICFLHDDDLMVRNHMEIMFGIVKNHPEISYLGCSAKAFYNDISDNECDKLVQLVEGNFLAVHYPHQFLCTGYVPGWVGALIDREKYIAIGGMPRISTGIGDFIMQGKFMEKWGVYHYEASHSLYCYRVWKGQASAEGGAVWMKCFLAEYYWYKYLNKKFHPFTQKIWNKISAYRVIRKCIKVQERYVETEINLNQLKEYCEWDKDILENKFKEKLYCKLENLYTYIHYYIAHWLGISGKIV